ncbi:hypothetical protein DV735_g3143, partial [Chaetothyriales sp. CBS 134920]
MSSSSSVPDFRTFLSTAILSDQHNISYRSLSRALKCHVNVAKGLLHEYYEDQNKRKAGSVYATYMIAGARKAGLSGVGGETNGHGHVNGNGLKKESEESVVGGDDDINFPSSLPPFSSSMLDPKDLESAKSQYEQVSSIHIYSLSPGKIPDLGALTDIGRGLFADVFSKEDPLLHNKTYGVITNPNVRRRKRRANNILPG